MNQIHVSVVLNMHREALYLRPTLYSLDACAAEAAKSGLNVELVAVFDRADEATLTVFESTQLSSFVSVKTVEIDVGSLGLARNAGIDIAEGEFIWTADGDDLVSRNCIVQLVRAARECPHEKVAIFIEYLAAFGEQYHVARYVGSEWLTAADFAYTHPYISRIFIRRAVFEELRYVDLKVTTGFAYEDWDFNCRLLAEGFELKIASGTVFFYRQRGNSLLKQANALSARLIPHSELFKPLVFCSRMEKARRNHKNWPDFIQQRQRFHENNFAKELVESPDLSCFVADAAQLEPEVEPQKIKVAPNYYPVPWDAKHWGFQLERFYELVGFEPFTDVVLLPWLRPGGAEKYILQILDQLRSNASAGRILVLSGQAAEKHEWVRLLPRGAVFLDLFNAFPTLDVSAQAALAARAILAVSEQEGRLHIKASEFGHRLMNIFGAAFASQLSIVYYRFCDDSYLWHNRKLSSPWAIHFLRNQIKNIDLLVSDCQKIVEYDETLLGSQGSKYQVIYAKCDLLSKGSFVWTEPKKRLLWASRVSVQKRPELLKLITVALRNYFPDLCVEVYGQIEAPYSEKEFFDIAGVEYCGPFNSFDSLPIERYDAFIYTSAFDGLPNIILEAMGAGLPVIAPDVGGISEAIIVSETGFLIPDLVDEGALVDAYVQAVQKLYSDRSLISAVRENAFRLIEGRHGHVAFARRVAEVFHANTMSVCSNE